MITHARMQGVAAHHVRALCAHHAHTVHHLMKTSASGPPSETLKIVSL